MNRWIQFDDSKCKCPVCETIAHIALYPPGSDKNFCPNCGEELAPPIVNDNNCPYCGKKPVFYFGKDGKFYDRHNSSKTFARSNYEVASIGADENGRICLWVCGDDISDPKPLNFCPECGRKLIDD